MNRKVTSDWLVAGGFACFMLGGAAGFFTDRFLWLSIVGFVMMLVGIACLGCYRP